METLNADCNSLGSSGSLTVVIGTDVQPTATEANQAPSNVAAVKGDDGITLSWNAPAAPASGFIIQRKRTHLDETDFTAVTTGLRSEDNPPTTNYVDSSASDGGAYFYRVDALDENSAVVGRSDEVTVRVGPIVQAQSQPQLDSSTAMPSPTAWSPETETPTETETPSPTATDMAGPTATETPCTLVDLITAANTDRASGSCLAGSGADSFTIGY